MISAFPPKAAAGRPPPTILPRHVKSGFYSVQLLCAAIGDAKAGDNLIEYQHRFVGIAQLSQRREIILGRRNNADVCRHRLDQNGGDVIFIRRKNRLNSLNIVVWYNKGEFCKVGRHTRTARA